MSRAAWDRGQAAAGVPASYYGLPILRRSPWKAHFIGSYFFLGGLAGASSLLAAGGQLRGAQRVARAAKLGALGAITLSAGALIADLGRPGRFANMLRVVKPTSPMSVGSWLLAGYGPAAGVAALSDLTGRAPRVGRLATASAAALGPAVATYTAVLLTDTAVPAWHEGYGELPFVFAGSAASAAGGLGMALVPPADAGPARRMAWLGASLELGASSLMRRRLGDTGEPYVHGAGGRLLELGRWLAVAGLLTGSTLGRRNRLAAALGGGGLLASSAVTRFGVFQAGAQSAADPRYTSLPQRQRLAAQAGPVAGRFARSSRWRAVPRSTASEKHGRRPEAGADQSYRGDSAMAERDIVDVLLEDHREVRSLFKQTADATGDARKELFDVIRATLVRHEVAEEMIVRPVSRSIGIDSVADERVEEESKAEEMLKELEGLDPSSREFAVKFEALHTAVEEHAEAEEREEFPALRQSVDPDRLRTMATIFERAKQLAPTHPHPSTPNTATANVLVGPFAAIADRARDAVRAAMG